MQDVVEVETFEQPSKTKLRAIRAEMNFDKPMKWQTIDDLEQFYALLEKPPLHSVVVKIWPAVAEKLLELTNTYNRPKGRHYAALMAAFSREKLYHLTGDTIKWSETGVMLDGQHRLAGCGTSGEPIDTHVVFGLPDDIFDLIDQGKKRSAGDILALMEIKNPSIVAGAIRRARLIESGKRGNEPWGLTPRKIREYATGSMKDIQDYTTDGLLVNAAFKYPPSMVTAILYLISRHSKAEAKDFSHAWVHGARVGRNENFDVLGKRLITIHRTGGGGINVMVLAAMVVQMYNHWHADVVATPRALKWDRKWAFPKLEFNKAEFLKKKEQDELADTRLPALQQHLLVVFNRKGLQDGDGNVEMPIPELARRSGVPVNQVGYVLNTMEQEDLVHCSKRKGPGGPMYRLKDSGLERLKRGLDG